MIFYGVATETLKRKLMADVSDATLSPAARADLTRARRSVEADDVSSESIPASKPHVEFPAGRRPSKGEKIGLADAADDNSEQAGQILHNLGLVAQPTGRQLLRALDAKRAMLAAVSDEAAQILYNLHPARTWGGPLA
jgi:hypothetical protein